MKKIYFLILLASFLIVGNVYANNLIRPYSKMAETTPATMKMTAQPKAYDLDEDNAPSGTEKLFSTDWMCLMYDYIMDNTGVALRMRFDEDGSVYIHDLFSINQDYWVTAKLIDNNIVIPLHQQVATSPNGQPLTLEVSTFKFGDDTMWSEIDREASEYTLCGQPDGSYISFDINKPWEDRQYLVLCDDNDGTYHLVGSIISTPVDATVITPPTDKEAKTYSFSYFAGGFMKAELKNVVTDGDDIYVEGLCPALPNVWLKGEYINDGNQVAFKSGQFMGADQYVHFFSAASQNPNASENNPDEPNWLKDSELICNVKADGSMEFNTDRYLAVTIAGDVAYTIKPRVLALYNEEGAIPAKPVITELVWMEVDFLGFVQPTYDVNEMYLNPENLSWRMYYDDEPFTFDPWEYQNLWESTNEIPYGFDDNWDFMFYNDIGEQLVAIYSYGYKNISIESVYSFNGKEFVSERAYYGDISTGIESIESNHRTITESTIYDLNGCKVLNPSNGMYIRSDRYSDGSVRNRKICIR